MANWDQIESSGNVEDRRGDQAFVGVTSIGTILLIGVVVLLSGGDSTQIQNIISQIEQNQITGTQGEFVDTKNYKGFAQKVIGSNNEIWKKELAKRSVKYTEPKLVLFRGATQSSCGGATSDVGPHYCPTDQTIYLDETFFEELTSRFGAKGGDVAEAYVMSHEVGHHVQNLNGIFNMYDTTDPQFSVKTELQADCYAGVWAGDVNSEGIITEKEVDQAIDAASAVGDDRIQKQTTGKVNPETWTHGSSAQRKQWFLTGYKAKDMNSCDTFK